MFEYLSGGGGPLYGKSKMGPITSNMMPEARSTRSPTLLGKSRRD